MPDVFAKRRAGVLLHPTSLPGPEARGFIGHDAFRFVEFLAASGMSLWQMLPLGPTHADGSPYNALSSLACDGELISLDWLVDRRLLNANEKDCSEHKRQTLQIAFQRFQANGQPQLQKDLATFRKQNDYWLPGYCMFMALKEYHQQQAWTEWDPLFRDRDPKALNEFARNHSEAIAVHEFIQFIFFCQWQQLRGFAHRHNILLFGDMPIYVALDSADVWSNRELFKLDGKGQPVAVAGVPPDYFSKTGQRWGNPLYRWNAMKKNGFSWWCHRIRQQLQLFDVIRIDHFRGLEACWEIPADCETAIDGKWVKVPGKALLTQLHKIFGRLPLVAEDLGIITPEVIQLRRKFELPGMNVLQFAFDGNPHNSYLPHNHEPLSVVYTGTHDNDTTVSWFEGIDDAAKAQIRAYLDSAHPDGHIPWALNKVALASVACFAVLPMQDLLSLGKGHRMNTPGTAKGNWQWRFQWEWCADDLPPTLDHLVTLYGRKVSAVLKHNVQ